jgi:hypothetical protein
MLSLFNTHIHIEDVNFQDIQKAIDNNKYIIINTMDIDKQNCLITNTLSISQELTVINSLIENYRYDRDIIVYGMNCTDKTVDHKIEQLKKMGFRRLYIYRGGMFEWLCLQDIYGTETFITTMDTLDILKYKSSQALKIERLENV